MRAINRPKYLAGFNKVEAYATLAAKWVEEKIPDDYGKDDEAPKYAKAAHKLDQFLKKFMETYEKFEGKKPTEAMIDEAKSLSVDLAERVGKDD